MPTPQAAAVRKVAEMMRTLDLCMLTTHTADGRLHSRPMSNNGEVDFDGDVWFFSAADTPKVREIEALPHVHLSYTDIRRFLFISMSGEAEIVRDPETKAELWIDDLERWFESGPESEDVVLIRVTPTVVEYWNGEDRGKFTLTP